MQLASFGSKALANGRANAAHHLPKNHPPLGGPGQGSIRSIHIPTGPRPQQINSTAQKVVSYSRHALNRFFVHLTAPSLLRAPVQSATPSLLARRGIQTSARASIQNGLTFGSRTALNKPFFLPKGPGKVVSRSVAQVGLGTARNFSSARPIFQNLVENAPVAGRALYELDLDELKGKRPMGKENGALRGNKKSKTSRKGEMAKPKDVLKSFPAPSVAQSQTESMIEQEMDKYFAAPTPRPTHIITSLLIPLAPTPTTRTPLPSNPPSSSSSHPSLLPRSTLLSIHTTHSLHATRVSSLFHRLDSCNVWADGATCEAYAHGTIGESPLHDDGTAVCTVLQVDFVGWTEKEVRGVIGESGKGWCVLEEHHLVPSSQEDSDDGEAWWDQELTTDESSVGSTRASSVVGDVESMDMDDESITRSFVMPTLDFSASFTSRSHSPPQGSSAGAVPFVDPPSQNGYFHDFREAPGGTRSRGGRPGMGGRSVSFDTVSSFDLDCSSDGFSDGEWSASSLY